MSMDRSSNSLNPKNTPSTSNDSEIVGGNPSLGLEVTLELYSMQGLLLI